MYILLHVHGKGLLAQKGGKKKRKRKQNSPFSTKLANLGAKFDQSEHFIKTQSNLG